VYFKSSNQQSLVLLAILCLLTCQFCNEKAKMPRNIAFADYHTAIDSIIISSEKIIRNTALNSDLDSIKKNEIAYHTRLEEESDSLLYYEFMNGDGLYNLKITYEFTEKKLIETEIKINHKDYNQAQLILFNLIQFYKKKLGEPSKDKGYFVFNIKSAHSEETGKLAIADESDNINNTISVHLYNDIL
jgi:hypothetical protein